MLRRLALEDRSRPDVRVWLIDRPLRIAAIGGRKTTELGLRCMLFDPFGLRIRDLPLRDSASFFGDVFKVGTATDDGFELHLLDDLGRDELRDCRSEEDDSDDDDTGFESSLEAASIFNVFGCRFFRARTGCCSSLFE